MSIFFLRLYVQLLKVFREIDDDYFVDVVGHRDGDSRYATFPLISKEIVADRSVSFRYVMVKTTHRRTNKVIIFLTEKNRIVIVG